MRDALEKLEAVGFVECFESRDGLSHWNLSQAAMKEVLPIRQLHMPEPVLKIRMNLPLKDLTAFEIISMLQLEGWP